MNQENKIREALGLKPISESNKKEDLNIIEKPLKLPTPKRYKGKRQSVHPETKTDFSGIKIVAGMIKKQINKHRMPKTHAEITKLRDELKQKESDLEVIQEIKEIRAREKTRNKLIKAVRRQKIKRFFKKLARKGDEI